MNTDPQQDYEIAKAQDEGAMRTYAHQKWLVERYHAIFSAQGPLVVGFASIAINSAILINGAAAVAVLALLGSAWDKPAFPRLLDPAIESLVRFAGGAVAAVLVAYISYVSQSLYAWADFQHLQGKNRWRLLGPGIFLQIVAIALAVCSLVCFVLGADFGLDALRAAKPVG